MSDEKEVNPFKKVIPTNGVDENNIANRDNKETDKRKLPEDVAKEFECVGVEPGTMIVNGISIDLRKITLKQAAQLVDAGFKYLKKKDKNTKPATV